ncbi:MAG: tetratricopeptide repeat protein [Bacteroidales bacterium]
MRLRYAIVLVFSIFFICGTFAQDNDQIEELYRDANAYFYFEDYEEALALYLNIYHHYPDNSNLDYRIGFCYLNIPGSKEKAVPYLERATQNLSNRYRENSIRETDAPVEALFYLGNAYYVNGQLDKAEEAYSSFRNQIKNERRYDMEYFNHQIEGIKRSRTLRSFPVNFIRSNLGSKVNNRFANFNPVVSGDGNTLAYTTQEPFYQAVYVSKKQGNKWGEPQNITLDLVVDGDCKTLSLSYHGDELYLFKDDDHVGNIYVTNFEDGGWTPMRKLNENINTEHYETHASISSDGTKLYFTSNREGGYGDLDIYVSERKANGEWGAPKNLGPTINTRFNENTPFITTNDETLFFSSDGHSSMGGYDIFLSQRKSNGEWSKPINLGYPINTTDDELFFHPVDDGSVGLMAVFDPKGHGDLDITKVEIFLPKYQRSIISSTDFFEKMDNIPSNTLVVDTVNVSGVALLDPSIPEHMKYLDNNNEYTVFFEGKPYQLRNNAEVTDIIDKKLLGKISPEKLDISPPDIAQRDDSYSNKSIMELAKDSSKVTIVDKDHSDSIVHPVKDSLSTNAKTYNKGEEELIDTIVKPHKIKDKKRELDDETRKLIDMLQLIASNSQEDDIDRLMNYSWNVSSDIMKLQSKQLAEQLARENKIVGFAEFFTRFFDQVNSKSVKRSLKHSRQISISSSDEDFFFRVQAFKKSASNELALLIDDAIISQPSISSFFELWEYLNKERESQFSSLQQEFISLVIENAVSDYFALPNDYKDELKDDLSVIKISLGWIIALSVIGVFVLILLFYIKRKS